jgi:hypothetical protein
MLNGKHARASILTLLIGSMALVACGAPTPPPTTGGTVTVTSITPNTGLVTGGTSVTVAGSGFGVGPTVTFGGTAASGVAVNSSVSLTATVPARTAGAVDVVVANTDGSNATLANGYTYVPLPTQRTKNDWQVDFAFLGGSDRLEVQILQSGGTLSGSGRDNNAEVDFVTTGSITANTINVTFTLSNGGSSRGSVTCTGSIDAGPPQTISGSFTSPTNEAVGGTSGSCDFS